MKKLFIFFVLLLVIMIAAIFIAPGFISGSMIEAAVKEQTGIDLQIKGDSTFSVFPEVVFEADGIKIKAYDGTIPLLTSEDVRVKLSFSDLLAGRIYVKDFYWNKPKIYMEISDKGVANWLPKRRSRHSGGSSLQLLEGLDSTEIKKITWQYLDSQTGQKYELEDGHVKITSNKKGEGDLVFSAYLEGIPLNMKTKFDVDNSSATSISSTITIGKKNTISLDGWIVDLFSKPSVNGNMKIDGENFISDIKKLFSLEELEIKDIPLKLASDIRFENETYALDGLKVSLGEMDLNGTVSYKVSTREDPVLEARLEGSSLDLNTLGVCSKESQRDKSVPYVWSSDLIDLTDIQSVNTTLLLSWDSFSCGSFEFKPLTIRARANKKEGLLLDEIRVKQEFGGYFAAKGKMEGATDFKGSLQLRWNDLALEHVVSKSAGRFLELPVTGTSELSFKGKSMRDFISNLDGNIQFSTDTGSIKGINLTNIYATAMNMMMGSDPSMKYDYEVASLKAEYDIAGGVLDTKTAELKVADMTITGTGKISLPDWAIGYEVEAKKHGKLIPKVQIKGSLSDPKITATAIRRSLATGIGAVVGGPAGAAIGAAIDVMMDESGNIIEPKREEVLPFDLKDSDNLEDNIKDFLYKGLSR